MRLLLGVDLTVVLGFELCRWDVSEAAVQSVLVEPVHPVQGGELEVLNGAERAAAHTAAELERQDQADEPLIATFVPSSGYAIVYDRGQNGVAM